MLFSYKFFTFSQLFSQHPNKFYYRKIQNIHLTQPKIKIKTLSKRKKEWDWREKEWQIQGKREIRVGGFGGGVEWTSGQWRLDWWRWARGRTRSVLGGSVLGGDDLNGGTDELPAATIGLVLGSNLANARVQSRWCYRRRNLGSALGGAISPVLRYNETNAIWG